MKKILNWSECQSEENQLSLGKQKRFPFLSVTRGVLSAGATAVENQNLNFFRAKQSSDQQVASCRYWSSPWSFRSLLGGTFRRKPLCHTRQTSDFLSTLRTCYIYLSTMTVKYTKMFSLNVKVKKLNWTRVNDGSNGPGETESRVLLSMYVRDVRPLNHCSRQCLESWSRKLLEISTLSIDSEIGMRERIWG